jgi:Ni,Fe-hydrogenase III large subunit
VKKEIVCHFCKSKKMREIGHINRAIKTGKNLFCDIKCAGKAKRKNISLEEFRQKKRDYDKEYRKKNIDKIKKRKREYFKKTYDPIEASRIRRTDEYRKKHRQYLSTEKYKIYKHSYDHVYRCKKKYGEFWESASLLIKIDKEVKKRKSTYEIKLENKTLNKALNRSRNGNTKRSYT